MGSTTIGPGVVFDTNGPKLEVLIDGTRYGPYYDLASIQEAILGQAAKYEGLIKTLKPNDPKITQAQALITKLQSAAALLNPGGPADKILQDIKARLEAEAAAKAAAPPPPPPPPPPAPPTPVANVATAGNVAATGNAVANTNTNKLSGTADGDSGAKQANAAGTNSTPSQPAGEATTPPPANSGQADPARTDGATPQTDKGTGASPQSGASDLYPNEKESAQQAGVGERPGKRLENPLGNLASYTYQISLYMVTPDAYEAFVASGRKDINAFQAAGVSGADQAARNSTVDKQGSKVTQGGAFLIAQSGGITTPGEKRAYGFEFDYGIDNLSFNHVVSANESQSSVLNTDIQFQIIEPYGFSFITKLREAQNQMIKYAGGKSNLPQNPTKQFFVLGIRFYGYDPNGRPVKGSDVFNGKVLDPNSGGESLFETFYEISLTSIKTKLDGKATVYTITAAQLNIEKTINLKKGMLYTEKQVTGKTVRDALLGPEGLITKLNKEQKDMKTNKTIKNPITYSIEWIGDAKEIGKSDIVSDAEPDKGSQAGSPAKNSEQATAATETKSAPNKDTRNLAIPGNWPIVQCIDFIISKSQWLEQKLKTTYTSDPQYNEKTLAPEAIKPAANAKIAWFNISPKINSIKWDDTLSDWAFDITYQIQTYLMPIIDNPYVGGTIKYYGPHKRYDYWYTGQNKEIISYEQTLDNLYFTVAPAGSPQDEKSTGSGNGSNNKDVGITTAPAIAGDQTGSGGGLGSAAAASFRTSLYDPNAYAKAKVTILGDPDFLVQTTAQGINGTFDRLYGSTGFNVNATGGQIFFEIDFKEAIDYTSSSLSTSYSSARGGTLSINDSIEFWRYPDDVKKTDKNGNPIVKGISYRLLFVKSTFQNGSFKQILEASINTFNPKESAEKAEEREDSTATPSTDSGGSPGNPKTTTDSTGMPTDPATNKDNGTASAAPAQQAAQQAAAASGTTTTTSSGSKPPVANDDQAPKG